MRLLLFLVCIIVIPGLFYEWLIYLDPSGGLLRGFGGGCFGLAAGLLVWKAAEGL